MEREENEVGKSCLTQPNINELKIRGLASILSMRNSLPQITQTSDHYKTKKLRNLEKLFQRATAIVLAKATISIFLCRIFISFLTCFLYYITLKVTMTAQEENMKFVMEPLRNSEN